MYSLPSAILPSRHQVNGVGWYDPACYGWATPYLSRLAAGDTVTFRPRGHSMEPLIASGQEVTVAPLANRAPQPGDVVLCRVRGQHYLHLIKAAHGERYLMGNNRGYLNGWIGRRAIYGRWKRTPSR